MKIHAALSESHVSESPMRPMHEQADYVSYREFTALVYGWDTPYGYNTTPDLIESLCPEDLIRYKNENYVSDLMEVFYCGDLSPSMELHLDHLILQFSKNNTGS